MTGKSDIYTFMDCPDRYEMVERDGIVIRAEYCKHYGGVPCKQLCKDRLCPRGYAR